LVIQGVEDVDGRAASRSGGSGSMGGQISDSIQRGLAPLNNIGSMMGGKQ